MEDNRLAKAVSAAVARLGKADGRQRRLSRSRGDPRQFPCTCRPAVMGGNTSKRRQPPLSRLASPNSLLSPPLLNRSDLTGSFLDRRSADQALATATVVASRGWRLACRVGARHQASTQTIRHSPSLGRNRAGRMSVHRLPRQDLLFSLFCPISGPTWAPHPRSRGCQEHRIREWDRTAVVLPAGQARLHR